MCLREYKKGRHVDFDVPARQSCNNPCELSIGHAEYVNTITAIGQINDVAVNGNVVAGGVDAFFSRVAGVVSGAGFTVGVGKNLG